jgi:prepilin-type N-terminal cleavage/methylation domain-containing protein
MKILSLFKNLRLNAGFTMIELLIVIAILGILAVAVLSAINPIEQINRSRDTGTRSDAEQLISAADRYYAFNGFYPWQIGASETAAKALAWIGFSDTVPVDSAGCTVAEKLSTPVVGSACTGADELKQTFIDRVSATTYNTIYLYNSGAAGSSTYACFMPQSQAFVQEVELRLGDPPTGPADYPAAAIGNTAQCGTDGNCVCLP